MAPYLIDQIKGTFGLHGSSFSESNHSSVIFFVMEHTEGMHGAMLELMTRKKSLMLKTYNRICHDFLQLKVIHQMYSLQVCQSNTFCLQLQNIYV